MGDRLFVVEKVVRLHFFKTKKNLFIKYEKIIISVNVQNLSSYWLYPVLKSVVKHNEMTMRMFSLEIAFLVGIYRDHRYHARREQ